MKNQKKNFILLALAVLCISNGLAQNKGYVAISIGPSIPVGDFASTDANSESSGFARPGAIFDISFAYKLGKNFGIAALLRGQANRVDTEAFENELNRRTGSRWTADSESWTTGGLLFGGYGSFPVSPKTSFETKALIGFLNATSPELYVTLNGSGGTGWVRQSSETATAFSYLLGAGFKFDAGKKICLLVSVDYLGSKPEFSDVTITSSNGGAAQKTTISQSIGTINFGFGVGYKL
jgi:hypothetical protein